MFVHLRRARATARARQVATR